jgi:hypothetical protein
MNDADKIKSANENEKRPCMITKARRIAQQMGSQRSMEAIFEGSLSTQT